MKLIIVLLASFFIPVAGNGQTFRGIVRDSKTGEALPYANIGIQGKQLGGVSDQFGRFNVSFETAALNDVVVISYVGYARKQFRVSELDLTQEHLIQLIPIVLQLDEIVVDGKRESVTLGNKGKTSRHTGWGDFSSSRGRAIGLLIPAYDVPVRVNHLFFHVDACEFDSALVRINFFVYQQEQLIPFASQQKNIFHTINQKKGWVEVRILEDIILRNEEVIVAIEWLDAWAKPRSLKEGGSYVFTISLAKSMGYHYQRQTPEEQTQLIQSSYTPSIYLLCTPIQD